jgi:hypothetical protein
MKRNKRRTAAPTEGGVSMTDDAGRVHLVVRPDPASGRARVELGAPIFKEGWQNDLATASANTAYAIMGNGPNAERAVELAQNAMAATSRLVDGLLAKAPPPGVACRAGCDHCCYQTVGVTAVEALAIHHYLRATLPAADLAAIAARVRNARSRAEGLSSVERFSPDHPCAFLEDGRCSIYEARPLSCRGMNSLDADDCAQRLHDPEARAAFVARGSGGRTFMEPIRAFHAVSAGLQLALSELFLLDSAPLDLVAALDLLLSGPPEVGDTWAAGGTPFQSARGGDSTMQPGIGDHIGALIAPPRPSR